MTLDDRDRPSMGGLNGWVAMAWGASTGAILLAYPGVGVQTAPCEFRVHDLKARVLFSWYNP